MFGATNLQTFLLIVCFFGDSLRCLRSHWIHQHFSPPFREYVWIFFLKTTLNQPNRNFVRNKSPGVNPLGFL